MTVEEILEGTDVISLASFCVNAVLLMVTSVSVICAFLAYFHQKNRGKKDTACTLAAHYADIILGENKFVSSVYKGAQLDCYINSTIKMNELRHFDNQELKSILDDRGIKYDDFMRKLTEIDPFVILNCRILREGSVSERESTYAGYVKEDPKTGTRTIRNEAFLRMDLEQEINDLLNQLEWFAMNCRYGLADEALLYQPLHHTFLSMVWMLYPTICMKNKTGDSKLYTNVIWLFLKWRKRLDRIISKTQRKQRWLENMAEIAKKMARSTRVKDYSGKRLR